MFRRAICFNGTLQTMDCDSRFLSDIVRDKSNSCLYGVLQPYAEPFRVVTDDERWSNYIFKGLFLYRGRTNVKVST